MIFQSTDKSAKVLLRLFFLALFIASNASPAKANIGDLRFKLTASDEGGADNFGDAVALSGNIALIGAPGDDNRSGSAYLFDIGTGKQLFKLTASDRAPVDRFGSSVSLTGDRALIGAGLDDNVSTDDGSAYLFDVKTGKQLMKLSASDAAYGDHFGSVAISGTTALIGANGDDDSAINSGSAYLFNVSTGQQLLKLHALDAAEADYFGSPVALSGNIGLISAINDQSAGYGTGAAYVFDITTGVQRSKLTAPDAAADDHLGFSIAIRGDKALLSAPLDDDKGENSGSVYLFDLTTGKQLLKLTANDGAAGDFFGYSVAMNDKMALVGAPLEDDGGDGAGAAYLFDLTTGKQLAKLVAPDIQAGDRFGQTVALNDSSALIGAFMDSNHSFIWSGSAYVFSVVPEPPAIALLAFATAAILVVRRARELENCFTRRLTAAK